jgi:hypothetical protein
MQCVDPHVSPEARRGRFSKTLEAGSWSCHQPQNIEVFITEHRGTLVLGLTKLTRKKQGHTQSGWRKPDRYEQSARSLLYNLSDLQQVRALLETFDVLSASAAALQEHPHHPSYHMAMGRQKKLTEVQFPLPNVPVKFDSKEILDLLCENGNFRTPTHQLFARNPSIRKAAWEKRRRESPPVRQYMYRIRRVEALCGEERRGYGLNDCSEFKIPHTAALRVVRAVKDLLLELWSYLVRHPSQVQTRFLPWNAKWQLHHPPSLDWLIPRLQDSLTGEYEPLRLSHPDLFHGSRQWQRLQAYDAGKLRWRGVWGNELRAQQKVSSVRGVMHSAARVLLTAFVRCYALLQCLVVKRLRTKTNERITVRWISRLVPQQPYAPTLSRPPPLL